MTRPKSNSMLTFWIVAPTGKDQYPAALSGLCAESFAAQVWSLQ
jgi:hypothetical protein